MSSVEGHAEIIFGFVGHMVSVPTVRHGCWSEKADTDNAHGLRVAEGQRNFIYGH